MAQETVNQQFWGERRGQSLVSARGGLILMPLVDIPYLVMILGHQH